MNPSRLGLAAFAIFCLASCGDDSSPTGGSSGSGRIEPGLVGTWVESPVRYSTADTLIFTDTRYRTPYLTGSGSQFSAKDGLVKGGPDWTVAGEYLRSNDTLWFDGLLGQVPNGVDKATARRYFKSGT